MSDKLAVSASISVLMMSIWVLFGTEAATVPLAPVEIEVPAAAQSPIASPVQILSLPN
ncbi:MAG: hypothetical protein R3D89_09775 [Sphingomonadaceae bacterium]